MRGNLDIKANIIVLLKGQLDAFSEKQFKTFVTNNLKDEFPFVIDLTKIDFLDSSGLELLFKQLKNVKNLSSFSVVGKLELLKLLNLYD